MALKLQRDAFVLFSKNLVHAYLIEVDDAFWSFLVMIVLLSLVVLKHTVGQHEVAILEPVEELTWPLLLHLTLMKIILSELVVDDRVPSSRH